MSIAVTTTATKFAEDWQKWHDALEQRRRDPHSFLAYTNFNLLNPGLRSP